MPMPYRFPPPHLVDCTAMARFFCGRVVVGLVAIMLAASSACGAGEKGAGPTIEPPAYISPENVPDEIVKTGVESRVAMVWNCDQPTLLPRIFTRADHGVVTIKTMVGPKCGRPKMVVLGLFYTSNPGFTGMDKVYVIGFQTVTKKINKTLKILVK